MQRKNVYAVAWLATLGGLIVLADFAWAMIDGAAFGDVYQKLTVGAFFVAIGLERFRAARRTPLHPERS